MRIRLSCILPLPTLVFMLVYLQPQGTAQFSFSGPRTISYANAASYTPATYAAGDIDGDGNVDLVLATTSVVNYGPPPQFQFLKGNGTGGFTASLLPISDPGTGQLLIADLNGDGHPDLIHAYGGDDYGQDQYAGALVIYLGDGHGSFRESYRFPLPAGAPGQVTASVADLNHDGKPDILVSTDDQNPNDGPYTQEDVFLNNGNGTLSHSQSIVDQGVNEAFGAIGDFNGDGKLDFTLVDTGSMAFRIFMGNGNGTFRESPNDAYTFDSAIVATPGFQAMFAADFDGDGHADLVVPLYAKNSPNAQPRIATLLAKQGGGFFWYTAASVTSVADGSSLVDLNGDRKPDFLYVDGNRAGILALPGQGGGKFGAPQSLYTASSGTRVDLSPVAAPLKAGGHPSIFFVSRKSNGSATLDVLINQSR